MPFFSTFRLGNLADLWLQHEFSQNMFSGGVTACMEGGLTEFSETCSKVSMSKTVGLTIQSLAETHSSESIEVRWVSVFACSGRTRFEPSCTLKFSMQYSLSQILDVLHLTKGCLVSDKESFQPWFLKAYTQGIFFVFKVLLASNVAHWSLFLDLCFWSIWHPCTFPPTEEFCCWLSPIVLLLSLFSLLKSFVF